MVKKPESIAVEPHYSKHASRKDGNAPSYPLQQLRTFLKYIKQLCEYTSLRAVS